MNNNVLKKEISLILFIFSIGSFAEPVLNKELKLNISSTSKITFTLNKTMAGFESSMSGMIQEISGNINMPSKTLNIFIPIKEANFKLIGKFSYANERMHEVYMESGKFPTAIYEAKIISYNAETNEAKTSGKMTIHGSSKYNFEIKGLLTKSGDGYLFTSNFEINLNDFNITVPDIKLATVSPAVKLNAAIEMKEVK